MGSSFVVKEENRTAVFWKEKRSQRLLTHHHPYGWSPALEKGGYTLEPAPTADMRVGLKRADIRRAGQAHEMDPDARKEGFGSWA